MKAEQFTVRLATADDDPAISALVVDGFLDKFRPIFGARMDRALRIMERWVVLEHASGGVTSLVTEGYSSSEIAGSVGGRTAPPPRGRLAAGGTLPRRGGLLVLGDSRWRGRPHVPLPRGRPLPGPLARAQPEPWPPPHPLGHDPPLLPALLLRRLRSVRRAAGGLTRLPAPGHRQAPTGRRRGAPPRGP